MTLTERVEELERKVGDLETKLSEAIGVVSRLGHQGGNNTQFVADLSNKVTNVVEAVKDLRKQLSEVSSVKVGAMKYE